jgi:hypothetical protein
MADLTQRAGDGSSAKEKAERDARWVGEFADELTVAIALREWDQAVSLVEEGPFRSDSFYDINLMMQRLQAKLNSLRHLPLLQN